MIAAAAVALELLLQWRLPIYSHQVTDRDWTIGYRRDVNSEDYRGPLLPRVKSAEEWRVLALGDSVTFGVGVAHEDSWSQQLQRLWQAQSSRPITVFNGGVEGASLADLSFAFKKKWWEYQPDHIILAVTGNMVSLALAHKDERPILPAEHFAPMRAAQPWHKQLETEVGRLMHRLCLPSFLSLRSQQAFYWLGVLNHNLDPAAPYGALLAHGFQQGDLAPGSSDAAWALFQAELSRFQAEIKSAGKTLTFLYLPPRFILSNAYEDNEKNIPLERLSRDAANEARRIASGFAIPFIDGSEALRAARQKSRDLGEEAPSLYLLLDYVHLDPKGHAAIAAQVARELNEATVRETPFR